MLVSERLVSVVVVGIIRIEYGGTETKQYVGLLETWQHRGIVCQ